MATLFQLTQQMQDIEDVLYETGGELTPEIEQEMNDTQEQLTAKVDNYNALLTKLKGQSSVLAAEIKRLTALKKTAENAEKNIKEHILEAMRMFGLTKLEGDYCKMSVRKSKSLTTEDEVILFPFQGDIDALRKKLPDYVTVEVKVSKQLIKDAYPDGILPAGCEWQQNESLMIR